VTTKHLFDNVKRKVNSKTKKSVKRYPTYTYGEGVTGLGQVITFSCHPDDRKTVKDFISEKIRHIEIPSTQKVNVEHGSCGRYTRYNIKQHRYAGGGGPGCGCYIEVLEILDPPDDRCGAVLHRDSSNFDSHFSEWETLEDAISAFEECWGKRTETLIEALPTLKGFMRIVICNSLTPWFYAIGDQILIGDYAFPESIQDDPVYKFGSKFVVCDEHGNQQIKTCMGTRFLTIKADEHPYIESSHRLVFFDDGSVWDESNQHPWWRIEKSPIPRPIKDEELWIDEAMKQFREFLSGKINQFDIELLNGDKFIGRLKKSGTKKPTSEGSYFAVVETEKGGTQKGWVHNFVPTTKYPDVITYVINGLKNQHGKVLKIEITDSKIKSGGKKWSGVFFQPSKSD
jgi:hypothetical protein